MLKPLFKTLRKNFFFNKIIRDSLVFLQNTTEFLEKRWPVSGTVKLNLNGIEFYMFSKCDDGIISPLFYNRSYIELDDLNVFIRLICDKAVLFDIGANTGLYSIVSGLVRKDADIHSFEPNNINIKRLIKNIELNNLNNIHLIKKAVGSVNKTIKFTIPAEDIISDSSSAIEDFSKNSYNGTIRWKNVEVEQVTLDSYCLANKILKVDIVKIDVEGYEESVLEGAKLTIKAFKPIILIETFLTDEKRVYFSKFIEEYDYYVYLIFSEGIVRTDQKFENNIGMNYLLLNFKTNQIFTPINELEKVKNEIVLKKINTKGDINKIEKERMSI